MDTQRVSVTLDEEVVERARAAAASHGVSLSCWLNAAAKRGLVVEDGLAAVREWEAEHGELVSEDLTWADRVVDKAISRSTR